MANSLGTLLVNVEANTTQLIQGFNRAETAVNKTTKQMTYAVKGLIGAFVGLNTLDIAKNFTKQLDLITSANNKLKLVTKTTEEYTNAQKRLFEVAQITSSGYTETVDLYSKLSESMIKMGKSQSDVFRTVETVNKAIALSGTTAEGASAAILQLGQAFGSGLLQGDELKSINENAQGLSKAIAEGMGVAVGELKQLGSEGKITSQILADALAKVSGSVDSNYSKMEKSISQSSVNISNAIQKIIGDFDKMTGASKNVASIFNDISKYLDSIGGDNLQSIADTAETIGKVALSAGALAVGVKAYNTAVQIATAYNAIFAGSYGAVNSAIVLATASQVAFNKAMKLSALGIAVTAIYGLSESFIEAKKRSDNLSLSVEELANNFDALELKDRLVDVNKELKKMDENIKGYNDTQKMMYQGGYDLAYKEKVQLEKSIALIDKKNEALKGGNSTTVTTKPKELNEDVKSLIAPIDVIYDKYAKLFQNLTESGKSTAENVAKIQKAMNDEIANLDKDAVQKRKDAERDKLKAVEDAENKRKDLTKEATELTISDVDKINAKYLEMYNVIKDTFNQEQMKAFNTSWQEAVEKANGTLDAQKAKQDLVNQALATATNEVDTINNKYMEMYEAIKDNPLFDEAKMTEFYKKWQDELDKTKEKLDFNTTIELDIIGDDKSVQRIEKSFQDLNKATKKYEDNRKAIAKGSAEEAKNEEMFRKDQMNGYINMAGALGSMFQQGSKEAATFQAAQLSLALVEGTRAILTAGTGDPYTAIPRMAAMAIMVKSLLGNIGVALGMNSTSTSGDSFSMATANTGSGTVLGDSKKASESITNALKTLEDFAEPQFEVLNSMNNYLESIANNIGGVSSLLVQNSATALGTNYTGGFNTGYKNNIGLNNTLGAVGAGAGSLAIAGATGGFGALGALSVAGPAGLALMGLDKLLLGGAITNVIGGAVNSVLGGLFGKKSVSRELKDSGITFADALLKNAKNDFEGSAYQTIATTVKTKSWFGSSSKTSLKTVFSGLNDEIENQFSLVLGGLYDTVLLSGQALDISSQSLYNSLDNFVVSIGKISLKDKTGTEIQEILTNIFSKIGDDLTKSVIPNLTGFQQVGEGLFDTLTRVATGIQEASFYSDRLGASITKYTDIVNKQGVVGFEALYQSIKKMEQGSDYSKNKNFMGIIDALSGTAEELYNSYLALDEIRITLSSITFYTDSLSKSMIAGAGSVSALSSGISDYTENFLTETEQSKIAVDGLKKSFSRLDVALPNSMQGFENLIKGLNLTTESGQKLYGSLIALSGSFAEIFKSSDSNKLDWARKSLTDIQLLEAQLTDILGNNQIAWIDATSEATLLKSVENARAKAELDGIVTDEEQTLTMQLWDLYEATKANNEATAESNKLKAEELAKTRASLEERLQDTIYANNDSMLTQLKRQRELADYTDATSISLLKQIYSQEDYNDKIAETKTILEKLLGTFTNLGDSVSDTIKTLAGANTDSMSATQQIKSFWEKRKEIDSLLALNGNLTESQQSRLSDLVGEVNSLATDIQGLDTSSSSITSELIGNLTSLESALNFKEEVLSVNIVGIASNVALIENIAGISATVPTLTNNTSNYVTNSDLSTDIKDILTTIKDNISNYPKRTMDLIDDVIRGNSRVKVQSN